MVSHRVRLSPIMPVELPLGPQSLALIQINVQGEINESRRIWNTRGAGGPLVKTPR